MRIVPVCIDVLQSISRLAIVSSMLKEPEVLAIIPARLNSKEVPRKSIRSLLGKPLIAYVIEASLGASKVTRTIVTTDSLEIADVARSYGAEIPFMRPSQLSQDSVQVIEVAEHAVSQLKLQEGYVPDAVVLLQPPSPLCASSDIDGAVNLFLSESPHAVISVTPIVDAHPYWTVSMSEDGLLSSFMELPPSAMTVGRQDFPPAYKLNGAIYAVKPDGIIRMASHPYVDKTLAYVMPAERSIDIDTEMDFRIVEALLRERQDDGSFAPVYYESSGKI